MEKKAFTWSNRSGRAKAAPPVLMVGSTAFMAAAYLGEDAAQFVGVFLVHVVAFVGDFPVLMPRPWSTLMMRSRSVHQLA